MLNQHKNANSPMLCNERLLEALAMFLHRDAEFLRGHGIVDYSMLVGVQEDVEEETLNEIVGRISRCGRHLFGKQQNRANSIIFFKLSCFDNLCSVYLHFIYSDYKEVNDIIDNLVACAGT